MVAMTKIEGGDEVTVNRRWSVVVSKQNGERLAKQHLENQKFEVYLPLMISQQAKTRLRPNGGILVRPFFPGILFVHVDPIVDQWKAIFSTQGVKTIYMAGERPAVVADKDVRRIQAQEENGFIKMIEPADVAARYQRGDKCRVRGLSTDIEATFLEPVDKDRVAILLNLFERETRAVVTLASLK